MCCKFLSRIVVLCFRNYGPTLLAQAEARKRNCEQVLWLYGEDKQVEYSRIIEYVVQYDVSIVLNRPLGRRLYNCFTRQTVYS
jgi:hypothetical protein